MKPTFFWFRRDLRLQDNAGLFHALKANRDVQPVFIFDTQILEKLEDRDDARVTFLWDQIERMRSDVQDLGSDIAVWHGDPVQIWKDQVRAHGEITIYTNRDYEPYAQERDQVVQSIPGITLKTYKDQVIFQTDEVTKDDGTPYTVFTPYSKKWKARLTTSDTASWSTEDYFGNVIQTAELTVPSLQDLGFERSSIKIPSLAINPDIIQNYDQTRDFPAQLGTTRLSLHLRFGTISPRVLTRVALEHNETYLNELIWREFYQMILWHYPHVLEGAFRPKYDAIKWRNDSDEFVRWCEGRTGIPLVDAGMRELNQTGFMHNRVRMVVASFLCKNLLIDWRWGEAYFARKLLDFDLASNNGGWQWAAGTGCDAAPYFRVFNPIIQQQKFDPDFTYIRTWVPEFLEMDYPVPMVDLKATRVRAIETYKKALNA